MERIISIDGKDIKLKEATVQRREVFWPWEYWALREHMASSRCDTYEDYILKVLMTYPMVLYNLPEIHQRPKTEDEKRNIIIRIPLKLLERVDNRRKNLLRTWREFLLYPVLIEGLMAAHFMELKGKEWTI